MIIRLYVKMIAIRFIVIFFIFIFINLIIILLVSSNLNNIKILSVMGCLFSLCFIVALCFFPFPFQDELINDMITNGEGLTNNIIPFKTIFYLIKDGIIYDTLLVAAYQLSGNVALFLPLGFSLFFLFDKKSTLKPLLLIIFVSISIEAFQMLLNSILEINYRAVDIDDIILNCIGGILGYYFGKFINNRITNSISKKAKGLPDKIIKTH